MRICFISPYSACGGAELSLIELIDALIPLGVECSCIVRSHGAMSDLLADRGVEPIVVPFKPWVHAPQSFLGRIGKMLPHRQIASTLRLVSAIKRSGCDLVYTNSITAGAGAMAAKIAGKPHIWHLREFGYDDYKLTYDLGLKFSRFLMKRLSSTYITNSMAVADAYRKDLAGTKLNVVYNAVEVPDVVEEISSRHLWRNPDAIRCILLGKYMPGKGQEDAVRAMLSLRQMNVPAELLLVGGTQDRGYHQHIEKLIERHNLADRVRMLGHSDDPVPLMKSADVVLMCSRREAFGRVTVEGMKLGKPVVGTRSGGTPEIVDEGQTGFLYESGNHEDLAVKIAYLHAHTAVRNEMGSVAYARARVRFNQANYGTDIANVIRQVLGPNKPEPIASTARHSRSGPRPVGKHKGNSTSPASPMISN